MTEKPRQKHSKLIAVKFTADDFPRIDILAKAHYFGTNRSAYIRYLIERDWAAYSQSAKETK